jgi:DNA-binding LacI/PurR family transcriptional regulator
MTVRKPSMADVARRAGVSPATVCNVLGSRKPVDRGLVERVRAAVAELGYEVDRIASQLRSGKARIITLLVPSLENPFFTSFIAAIERCVSDEGYDIVVASSGDDEATERARLSALLSWRPAGVAVIPCTDAFAARSQLDALDIPYVIADRATGGQNADTVTVDNEHAAAMAASHLLDLGHRDVLVVASSLTLANIRERCAGVGRAFSDAGEPQPQLVEVGLTFDGAADRLAKWLQEHVRPTAMIALTNFATFGALAAFARVGILVPQQMSLVGFDDYAWMCAAAPSITAVRQPIDQVGCEVWNRLQSRIAGDASPPVHLRLACELKVRNSTARVSAENTAKARKTKAERPNIVRSCSR